LQQLAVLEDRARIARELHDGVIQSLFGAGMLLEGIRESKEVPQSTRDGIARVTQMIDGAMIDVRSSIYDLRPSALTGRNIEQALRSLVEDFEKASSIPCKVSFEPEAVRALESSAQDLVQIVREALSNIARHSQASACTLAVFRKGNEILLEVSDNGRGFGPANATAGIGLKNIRRRATQIGDNVEVISEPGKGSTVRVTSHPDAGL
jgi:NarL family two-component system sensor histidine kinase LiaS